MISTQALDKFRSLYLVNYGIKLSREEAMELGSQPIKLVKAVYGSDIPKKWTTKIDRNKIKE